VRISTGPATPPAFTVSLNPIAFTDYSDFGTRFYDTGFAYDGTGTVLQINTTNVVWRKTPGLLNGPLNRSGVSGSTVQTFIWYGFSACLTGITTSKTYYVGIAADNEYRLVLDGQEILNTYTPTTSGSTNTFRYWNVYPVQMDAGNHSLEVYGMNDPGAGLNPHGFGMEIYDNTLSQLTAATSVNNLNIVWSSSGRTTAEIVQNNAGYYLSSGYTCPYPAVYSVCSGNCVTYEYCYAPGISPTPTRSATPTPTASVTPSQTQTGTPTQTQTPTGTQTPTPEATPTPTSTPASSTNVYFNLCGSGQADGGGFIEVTARAVDGSGNTITVDTNVTLQFQWVGDLSSTITGNITIFSGFSCNSNSYLGANIGENVSTFDFNASPSPASSSTQTYNNNFAQTGICILGC
jgi:hypothetical protein